MPIPAWRRLLALNVLLLLLLAACGANTTATENSDDANNTVADTTSEEVEEPTAAPTATDLPQPDPTTPPTATPESSETMDEEMEEETADTPAAETTEDPRPTLLRSVTSTWNTDWTMASINLDELMSGGPPRDGIPPIDNPTFESFDSASGWLADNEPVISLEINGEARAYPLQILTWHEIVNDELGGVPVSVTFCPLCNSALVFDRRLDGVVYDFGTSGLLRNSDLVMWDRQTETLWQQFTGEAIVGELNGAQLVFVPSSIISFADFRAAYPDGEVLSVETGFNRRYGANPYPGYDTIGSSPFLFTGVVDGRLAAVARVVTVGIGEEFIAYPYDVLGDAGVVNDTFAGVDLAVFWQAGTASALGASSIADAEDVGATGVFDRALDGQTLTFFTDNEGRIFDEETGSEWNIAGQAIDGELSGQALTRLVAADHFWFSWAAFRPDTVLYTGE